MTAQPVSTVDPRWAEHIRRLVDQAPPLSPAQVDRLAVLLRTAPAPEATR